MIIIELWYGIQTIRDYRCIELIETIQINS